MAAHAFLKITLFFCAGSVYVAAHAENLDDLDGIGRRMPFTMGAFALAALLLVGLPPGLAFASKWRLVTSAASAGDWLALAALGASTLLAIAYFVPIVTRAFLRPAPARSAEAPLAVVIPLLVTVGLGLWFGLDPDAPLALLSLAERAASNAAGRP
jgi:multicomponent Na+:H+ antiporter subunit D